jgi:signal transduction histidine kinase
LQQQLIHQLEPVALRLRSRIDSLFDQAKTPLLAEQAYLPIIQINELITTHLPELKRMAAMLTTITGVIEIELEHANQIQILGREGELQRVFENLVLNAVGAGATRICISIKSSFNEGVIVVQDNGPGFPEWMLNHPLKPLTTHRSQGTGLGLAGVIANVKAFGGHLKLDNNLDGAIVILSFPCAEELQQICNK